MGKQRLKPGQHGAIFVERTGSKRWRARTRLRLFDGGAVWVARAADSKDGARLRVQEGVAERLGAPTGSIALGSSSTVEEACRQWISELRVRQAWPNAPVRPQTVDEYERSVARHVEPRMGRLRLQELTPAIVQAWIDGMIEGAKDGPYDMVTTTAAARGALVKVLDRAVLHDALRDNPARKTRAPVKKLSEPKAMTAFDVGRLRAAVRSWEATRKQRPGPTPTGHLPVVVDVMLGTGMRIGEAMALHWGEVRLALDGLSTIAVEATLTDVKGQGTVRQPKPKTDAGDRVVILPAFVVASLRTIRPMTTTAGMPVFPSRRFRDGRNVDRAQTTHNIRRTLRAALDAANLKGEVYPHLLRKTVATRVAREMGVAEAAALLGHRIDAGVTGRHYIERIRLAPDTSAVLQALVEIGDAEYAQHERGWIPEGSADGAAQHPTPAMAPIDREHLHDMVDALPTEQVTVLLAAVLALGPRPPHVAMRP